MSTLRCPECGESIIEFDEYETDCYDDGCTIQFECHCEACDHRFAIREHYKLLDREVLK